jgi:hypothetical protein
MVVLNAVRGNPWLRQYYERLRAAGKPGKVVRAVVDDRCKLFHRYALERRRRRSRFFSIPGRSTSIIGLKRCFLAARGGRERTLYVCSAI